MTIRVTIKLALIIYVLSGLKGNKISYFNYNKAKYLNIINTSGIGL